MGVCVCVCVRACAGVRLLYAGYVTISVCNYAILHERVIGLSDESFTCKFIQNTIHLVRLI
jgi:hypothetical protein